VRSPNFDFRLTPRRAYLRVAFDKSLRNIAKIFFRTSINAKVKQGLKMTHHDEDADGCFLAFPCFTTTL